MSEAPIPKSVSASSQHPFHTVRAVVATLDAGIQKIEQFILGTSTLALTIVTTGNVFSRKLFNYSWSPTEEVLQFILVIVTFIGISYAARRARHIRMTAFYELLNEKGRRMLMIAISLVTCIILLYLTYYSYEYVAYVKNMGRVTPALRIPFYIVIIWAPIGLFLGSIQYFLTFYKNLTSNSVWVSASEQSEYSDEFLGGDNVDILFKHEKTK